MSTKDDAARWAWFRAHWGQIIFHTEYNSYTGRRDCKGIDLKPTWNAGNGESLDAAIDEMRKRDEVKP